MTEMSAAAEVVEVGGVGPDREGVEGVEAVAGGELREDQVRLVHREGLRRGGDRRAVGGKGEGVPGEFDQALDGAGGGVGVGCGVEGEAGVGGGVGIVEEDGKPDVAGHRGDKAAPVLARGL